MNDERDHDTEHIEKFLGFGKKKESKDDVDDASSTHNSTDGTANRKSGGWGVLSGWRKQADGQVEEPTYEGKDSGPTFETISPLNMGGEGPKPDENKPPAPKPKEEEPKEPTKENDGSYVPIGVDITPEQIAQHDARQNEATDDGQGVEDKEKIPEEFDPNESEDVLSEKKGSVLDDTAAGKQQSSWMPSVTSQRMMDAGLAGLNMFGGIMGGANKAFSILRGLASALTSRQLMSDPTLPARGFLNAMEQSGQIVEDHIRQVGEAYGIKDGVKRDDLVGTYKGAQYYREKQQIENAEKQYYAGVGNALSAVLGNNVDVNDTVGIQNALAQMTPQQLSQLDDALFGQNGSLKDMYEATVVNPMGSTREQKARAQLLTTLNQSLKGQAQTNAREAGRQRTQANQQIQQYNQENRRIKAGQEQQIAMAEQMLRDPTTMANISDDAQMEAFVNAVLGRKINNKQIPTNRNGEVEIGTLKEEDLRALMNRLQQPEFQNLSGAMTLKNEVNDRLEAIKQNKAQTTAQNQANAIAPIANSPLDLDISVDRKNLDRDRFGIPHDRGARSRLRDKAKDMIGKIRSTTNSPDDIALCENVITMCDMADARESLSKYAGDLVKKGIISNIDRDIAIQNADKVYELMANSLATTVAERTNRVNSGQDWKETAATRAIDMRMKGTENFLRMKHKQFLDDKQAAKDQAAQDKADAEKAKADAKVAEYEKAANRDGRGISLAPWTPGSNRYRNDDLKNANTELAQIEKELATISPTDKAMNGRWNELMNKRVRTQSKIRQIHQENHIQKLIYDAGSLPDGEANNVRQKAEALRGQYSDWKEFGKAINDIRKEAGLKKSTAWSSSERAEREQQAHSENQALIDAVKNLTDAVKGQPDAMKNMINDFLADKDGKFEGKVLDILEKSYGNLTDQLLGDNSKLPGLVEKAMRNAFDNHIRDEAGKMIGASVSNAIEPTRRLAEGIRDISKSIRNEIQRGKLKDNLDDMLLNVTSMESMLSQALIDTAENKVVNLADMKRSIDTQVEANTNAIKGLVSSLSAAGSGKPEFALSEEDKTRMEQLKDALSTQNSRLTDLIDRMDKGGVVTRQDILDILGTLNDADRNPDATNMDDLEDNDWEDMGYSVDDINELMDNYAYLINMSADFARGLEAQDQQGAFPVRLTDDAMETLANMISRKIIEAGGLDAWKAQNTATATVQPEQGEFQNPARDVRDDASEAGQETVSEATGPEVEEQVDQPVEEAQTATEEGGNDRVDFSTMTREQMDQYLKEKFPNLYEDMRNFVDEPLDMEVLEGWEAALGDMVRYPLLNRYISENPEVMKGLYRLGKDGVSIHQTFKGQIQKAMDHNLFNGEAAEFLADYAEDLLSQTSRDDLRATARDWRNEAKAYTPEQAQLQSAVINNIETQIETSLEDILRKDAERRMSLPPNDADVRTNGYQATDDMRRTIKIMAESMAEEAELKKQGLDGGQIKQKMAESQAEQKKVAEAGTKAIVPEQDSEVGKRMAESVRDTLFYSKKGPQWADYRSVIDRLADMKERYPQEAEQIDKVREDIVLGMVVPQLMGFKNVANVAPSDKLSMDKIKEISRRAMEFGLAKRQEVTDRANAASLAGKNYTFTDEDEYWLGFPTVDELVNSHIYGRNSDKDPVNINRARVHRQEEGNKYNNRLKDAYRVAKKEATIRDNIQAKVDDLTSEAYNPFVAYNKMLGKKLDYKALLEGTRDTLTNRTPIETIKAQYESGDLSPEKLDAMISKLEAAKKNALDYKKMINNLGSTLYTDTNLKVEDGEGGEVSLPEDALEEINNARRAKRDAIVDQDWVKNGLSRNGEIVKYIKDLKALRKTDPKQNVAQEETSTGTDIVDDMDISEEQSKEYQGLFQ